MLISSKTNATIVTTTNFYFVTVVDNCKVKMHTEEKKLDYFTFTKTLVIIQFNIFPLQKLINFINVKKK